MAMKWDAAREAALKILYEINENGAYSNIALNKYFSAHGFPDRDRAFITELVYGVVKWKLTLDRTVAACSEIRMEKLSPWIKNILRLGTYQLLYLTRVPASAAVNESVNLARRYGHKASAGYVNAVLRNIAGGGGKDIVPDRAKDPVGHLSVRYSYPKWITERFVDLLGEEFAERLLEAGNRVPDLTVRANTLKTSAEGLIESLKSEGVESLPGKYVREAVIIKSQVSVTGLEAFRNGLFQVQDESSMLPAIVLAPQPGEKVLDACSAPGGKARYGSVDAEQRTYYDGYTRAQLKLIKDAADRLEQYNQDGTARCGIPVPQHEGAYDRVLLDAPCSGLGIIRRKPDIKWSKESRDVGSITALQRRLINSVSKAVRPGGVMVYSTCTLLPEENERIVRDFLNDNDDFCEDNIAALLPPGLSKYARGCMLQVYPNRDGTDGFFIARLARKVK